MIPVKQTKLHDPPKSIGNCFQACLASILEISIEDTFDIFGEDITENNWIQKLNEWLAEKYDLCFYEFRKEQFYHRESLGYHIISGKSPRNPKQQHSVVGYEGEMVFDPHPSNDGILTEGGVVFNIFIKLWKN